MRTALVLALLASLVVAARAGDEQSTHTGLYETPQVAVRYRPSSRAAASVESVGAAAGRDLERIRQALDLKPAGRVQLFLYDDVAELSLLTGTKGNGGFSAGDASHVPYDNDQTRFHELVHVVAAASIPKQGDEPRNLFFAEGLSNALLEHVHGVPVHAVAKYYRTRKLLPPLAEMTGAGDFYVWQEAHPKFDAYDVAGSWFRFLLDSQGAAKVKRYYGGVPAKTAFGQDAAAIEKAWLAALDAFVLRPEVEILLRQRHGEDVAFVRTGPAELPADLLGAPGDWTSLLDAALHADTPAHWKRTKEGIVGTPESGPAWTLCELGDEMYGDCVVRARILTPNPAGMQVRLDRANQAMIVNGTFLYRDDEAVAFAPRPSISAARRETDLALVRRNGQVEVWVDGEKILTKTAAGGAARPGIAVVFAAATFTDVRVRRLGTKR